MATDPQTSIPLQALTLEEAEGIGLPIEDIFGDPML